MDAGAWKRVQIDRERRHQRLALAGPHLGDFTAVKRDPANHLDVVMALAERPLGRLAHRRKGLWQQIVELGPVGQPLAENDGLPGEFLVGQRADRRLERVDRLDDLAKLGDIAVVRRSEDALGQSGDHDYPSTNSVAERRAASFTRAGA